MSRQVSYEQAAEVTAAIANGAKGTYNLPAMPLGYSAVVGNIRADQNVSIYLQQGKVGDYWLGGASAALAVTGSSVDDSADDGTGESFGFQITSPNARLIVSNASGSEANILLEYTLVGLV